jgi:hypothetical protein
MSNRRNQRHCQQEWEQRQEKTRGPKVGSIDGMNQVDVTDTFNQNIKVGDYFRPAVQRAVIPEIFKPRRIAFDSVPSNILVNGGTVNQIIKTESIGAVQFFTIEIKVRS